MQVCIKKKGEAVTPAHGAVRNVSKVIHDLVVFKYHHGGRGEYRVDKGWVHWSGDEDWL